ncbi:hypothetical protein J2X31_001497 [Flavobacterium arsenatis]|uniref:Lipocalin-like domain-containing protein n=1 Tax=Flavobacterium arsenatis TaxID=1484332 RepID=A0ABU1TND3_9FLAO|nr:hypothetical protein [Flavobacterium arsenatis]MDR6967486.1 hypothetical protein [Flavobacterium arsenatis]
MLLKTNTLAKITLSIAIAFTMMACEDQDDEIQNAGIEGTYKLTTFTLSAPIDYNNDGVATTNLIEETGCYDASNITLLPNGSAVFNIQSVDIDYIPEDENGNPATVVECYFDGPETASYTSSTTLVTFSVGEESMSFTRTGNTLTYIVEGDDSFFGDVVLVFEKQ